MTKEVLVRKIENKKEWRYSLTKISHVPVSTVLIRMHVYVAGRRMIYEITLDGLQGVGGCDN